MVNAGTNDFASGKLDSARFVDAAVNFIGKIRSYHPQAKIVILDGPMLIGEEMQKCRRMLDRVKAMLEGQGVKDLFRFSLEPKVVTPFGIYYHPNKEEAAMDAESEELGRSLEPFEGLPAFPEIAAAFFYEGCPIRKRFRIFVKRLIPISLYSVITYEESILTCSRAAVSGSVQQACIFARPQTQ